jgi:uncharacterized protein (DUF58 family)
LVATHVPRIKARLTLPAQRKVLGLLDGEYASTVTGRGTEFNDLREYVRGDDVKDLDWKATARTGQPLVRRYVAVRRRTVLLVCSTGRSMAAAHTAGLSKRDLAVEVAGLLGWLATRQGDLVGTVYGDATGFHALPARSGELHLERCLSAVHDAIRLKGPDGDLVGLLGHVARTVRRRALVLVVCDEEESSAGLDAALRRLAVQHEVLVASIGDVDPVALPEGLRAHDLDTGRRFPAWLREDAELTRELAEARATTEAAFRAALVRTRVTHEYAVDCASALPVVRRLLEKQRHARRR